MSASFWKFQADNEYTQRKDFTFAIIMWYSVTILLSINVRIFSQLDPIDSFLRLCSNYNY